LGKSDRESPVGFAVNPTAMTNGKIAFASDRDGNYEIYVMNADGSGQTRLTNNSSKENTLTGVLTTPGSPSPVTATATGRSMSSTPTDRDRRILPTTALTKNGPAGLPTAARFHSTATAMATKRSTS